MRAILHLLPRKKDQHWRRSVGGLTVVVLYVGPFAQPDVDAECRRVGGTFMDIAKTRLKWITVMRRRRAAQPKRDFRDWVALTIARLLTGAIVGGVVYLAYLVETTSYDDFKKCDRQSTISRIEWVFGIRPAEDCRRY